MLATGDAIQSGQQAIGQQQQEISYNKLAVER